MLGRTHDELLEMSWFDIIPRDDRVRVRSLMRRLSRDEDFFSTEQRYVHGDGSTVWVHCGVSAIRDDTGRLTGVIAIVNDISDLIHATLELAEANDKKDEFLGLVSHELRTPITTILGNAKILNERGTRLSERQLQQAYSDVQQEAQRLSRIIQNMLAIARLDRGRRIEIEPVVIGAVLNRVVASHAEEHPEHHFHAETPRNIVVDANELLVEQVLSNLLGNAGKYAESGTCINVRSRVDGRECVVTIEDDGVGIDPSEAEMLFDPFYRSARTSPAAGMGIGLSVCRRLVEVMGGRIWAEPGASRGAVFSFALPLSRAPDSGNERPGPSEPAQVH
jgi:PAS domain S-box-containing protein